MYNPNMEAKVHELMELKRMKEALEAEIAAAEDAIKAVMGDEELLTAGEGLLEDLHQQPRRYHSPEEGAARRRRRLHHDHHKPPLLHKLKAGVSTTTLRQDSND